MNEVTQILAAIQQGFSHDDNTLVGGGGGGVVTFWDIRSIRGK